MLENPAKEQFAELLEKDILLAGQLATILDQEYQALSQNGLDELELIATHKKQVVEQIEANTQARVQLLLLLKVKNTTQDIEALIASCHQPLRAQLTGNWQKLKQILNGCYQQNQINGRIIHISQQTTQQLLGVLYGKTSQHKIYTPQGQLHNTQGSHYFDTST
jgi:flagellar biosynthesis/type III secretory pathway chaperone